jgi:hypothetical protein
MIIRSPLLIVLLLGLMPCSLSAQADTSSATTPPANPSTQGQKTSQSTKSFVAHLPVRLVSFAVGTAVGTPIAWVRCTHTEIVKRTKEAYNLGGVRPKPLAYLSAGCLGLPSGILSGAWSGAFNGVADSWVNSKDAPFSKDTFSLEKLELENLAW